MRNKKQEESQNFHKFVEIKEHILNNQWFKEEIKKYLEINKNVNTTYGMQQRQFL